MLSIRRSNDDDSAAAPLDAVLRVGVNVFGGNRGGQESFNHFPALPSPGEGDEDGVLFILLQSARPVPVLIPCYSRIRLVDGSEDEDLAPFVPVQLPFGQEFTCEAGQHVLLSCQLSSLQQAASLSNSSLGGDASSSTQQQQMASAVEDGSSTQLTDDHHPPQPQPTLALPTMAMEEEEERGSVRSDDLLNSAPVWSIKPPPLTATAVVLDATLVADDEEDVEEEEVSPRAASAASASRVILPAAAASSSSPPPSKRARREEEEEEEEPSAAPNYSAWKVDALRGELKQLGMDARGIKADLVARLQLHHRSQHNKKHKKASSSSSPAPFTPSQDSFTFHRQFSATTDPKPTLPLPGGAGEEEERPVAAAAATAAGEAPTLLLFDQQDTADEEQQQQEQQEQPQQHEEEAVAAIVSFSQQPTLQLDGHGGCLEEQDTSSPVSSSPQQPVAAAAAVEQQPPPDLPSPPPSSPPPPQQQQQPVAATMDLPAPSSPPQQPPHEEEEAPASPPPTPPVAAADAASASTTTDWRELKLAELKRACEERGLDSKGRKDDLVRRLSLPPPVSVPAAMLSASISEGAHSLLALKTSPPSSSPPPRILFTSYEPSAKQLKQIAKLGGTVLSAEDDDNNEQPTHVVVIKGEIRRTLKLLAILAQFGAQAARVVHSDWLVQSLARGEWIQVDDGNDNPYFPFEKNSSLEHALRVRFAATQGLFHGLRLLFVSSTTKPSYEQFQPIIRLAGGTCELLTKPDQLPNDEKSVLLVGDAEAGAAIKPAVRKAIAARQLTWVTAKWLVQSLTSYSLQAGADVGQILEVGKFWELT